MKADVCVPEGRTTSLQPIRRILAIWLARLSVDRWRLSNGIAPGEGPDAEPLALITETAHGPRIDALNALGLEAGAQAGMMLADARTLCPHIKTALSDPAGDLDFLEKLGVWSQRWGPWSTIDAPDGLLVDITAAAHLFGGEERLLADAEQAFAQRGLFARVAIASTAGAAWALAHYGRRQAAIPPGRDAMRQLEELPVAALRLDNDVVTVLKRLGLKRLGDLRAVVNGQSDAKGRDALHRRFRNRKSPSANPLVRLDQLLGLIPEPLLPIVPQSMPMVQRRLMEPIRHRSLLDQVFADLAQDMVRELEARGEGARRLEIGLWRVDGEVLVRKLELSQATRDSEHITRLFSEKLDDVEAGFGIEVVRLRASWSEPLELLQNDIEDAAERHGTSLSAFVDRVTIRLGPKAVRRPEPYSSHIPERAQRLRPVLEPQGASQETFRFNSRPLKLLDRAELIEVLYATPDGYPQKFRWRGKVRSVSRVEGPERIAPEWWRERSTIRLRDYFRVEDEDGSRYWIYRHGFIGDGRGGMPDWYLHGLDC